MYVCTYEGLPGWDGSTDEGFGPNLGDSPHGKSASLTSLCHFVLKASSASAVSCVWLMPTFGPCSFFAAVWALTSVLPWSRVRIQRNPFPSLPLVECHCHCEVSGPAPSACSEVPSSSTGWASSVVGVLVAVAGVLGFIFGLFVAGGLWGAVQCCRQVLVSWWGLSSDSHHAAPQALRDREVRGAVPRAQWS